MCNNHKCVHYPPQFKDGDFLTEYFCTYCYGYHAKCFKKVSDMNDWLNNNSCVNIEKIYYKHKEVEYKIKNIGHTKSKLIIITEKLSY